MLERRHGHDVGARRVVGGRRRTPDPRAGRCATIADVQVRPRHIGGNVCVNDPTNHFPPFLVALGADIHDSQPRGERTVGADEFFLGVYLTAVAEGELLTKISVPARKPGRGTDSRDSRSARTAPTSSMQPPPSRQTASRSRSDVSTRFRCARARWRKGSPAPSSRNRGAGCGGRTRRDTRPTVRRPRVGCLPAPPGRGVGGARCASSRRKSRERS